MAITGTIRAAGHISGAPSGPRDVALAWPITSGVDWHLSVALTTGNNALAVPAGTTVVIIVPPVDSTVTLAIKGSLLHADETGFPLHPSRPALLSWDPNASPSGFAIVTNGNVTIDFGCL